jgi:DNA-binding winged helix-turn-helix (wHTH) protein
MRRAAKLAQATNSRCPCCGAEIVDATFHVDLENNVLVNGSKAVKVSGRHAELIWLLHRRYPNVVPRDDIIAMVWGVCGAESKTVDTTVCMARRHLEQVGYTIKCEYGVGYRLVRV